MLQYLQELSYSVWQISNSSLFIFYSLVIWDGYHHNWDLYSPDLQRMFYFLWLSIIRICLSIEIGTRKIHCYFWLGVHGVQYASSLVESLLYWRVTWCLYEPLKVSVQKQNSLPLAKKHGDNSFQSLSEPMTSQIGKNCADVGKNVWNSKSIFQWGVCDHGSASSSWWSPKQTSKKDWGGPLHLFSSLNPQRASAAWPVNTTEA